MTLGDIMAKTNWAAFPHATKAFTYAGEALKTNVGISHIDQQLVRHGTPDSALAVLAAGKTAAVADSGAPIAG